MSVCIYTCLDRFTSHLQNEREIHIDANILFDLFKKSNHNTTYKNVRYFIRAINNDKPGILTPIPRAKNHSTFNKNEHQQHWFEIIISFIVDHNNMSRDYIIHWMLNNMYKKWPHVLVKLATDVGMIIVNKM